MKENEKVAEIGVDQDVGSGEVRAPPEHLSRKLGGKEVQLFSIGGAIGTSVFVTMGAYLPRGGPAGLLIGYAIWGLNVWCVNSCLAEMTVYAPVASPFVTFTAQWVDEALAFSQAWAFFICQALLVPAEITALQSLIEFWTTQLPAAATVIICLVLYSALNLFSVGWFGKAEFYLSIGKVFLIFICFGFTFFTMVGCNPHHDSYGFRYWKNRTLYRLYPDANMAFNTAGAFAEYLTMGSLGSFWGTVSCMSLASFALCGPEYTSSVAAETESPRRILPSCFKSFKWRLGIFFVGSALCLGIVIPYNDQKLADFIAGTISGGGTTAASPYTIAMERLDISGLPHLLNALMLTSVFSCGNGVLFAASRALFAMGKSGRAPAIFAKTTKRGIPIYAVIACLLIGLLAMMRVDDRSFEVLAYFIDLCTICGQFNYFCICVAYVHFYYNMQRQGKSRDSLPYKASFQPYGAYIGATMAVLAMLFLGFDVLNPFLIKWFFLDYTLLVVFPTAAILWKLIYKTKYVRIGTADLRLGGMVQEVDDYEDLMQPRPEGWVEKAFSGVWEWKDLTIVFNRKAKE